MSLLALILAATAPSPEAIELGRRIANAGLLATLGPMQAQSEVDGLLKDNPELSADQQTKLKDIGAAQIKIIGGQVIDAEAKAYAETLSIENLQAIANWLESPAAKAQKDAMPAIILATMTAMNGVDFKGTVKSEMCRETGKLCEK